MPAHQRYQEVWRLQKCHERETDMHPCSIQQLAGQNHSPVICFLVKSCASGCCVCTLVHYKREAGSIVRFPEWSLSTSSAHYMVLTSWTRRGVGVGHSPACSARPARPLLLDPPLRVGDADTATPCLGRYAAQTERKRHSCSAPASGGRSGGYGC